MPKPGQAWLKNDSTQEVLQLYEREIKLAGEIPAGGYVQLGILVSASYTIEVVVKVFVIIADKALRLA